MLSDDVGAERVPVGILKLVVQREIEACLISTVFLYHAYMHIYVSFV